MPLHYVGSLTDARIRAKFPHLVDLPAFKIDADMLPRVSEMLKSQVVVSAVDGWGHVVDVTSPQLPGVLDDLFAYDGSLGVTFADDLPTLQVWAPTARSVAVRLFDDSRSTTIGQRIPMEEDPTTGVWSVRGSAEWTGKFYLYEVDVFMRATGRVEKNLVTDPYSVCLSTNSQRSQIVDLRDPRLMPDGWNDLQKPRLDAPEDIVLYELHVRDFSISDLSVSEGHRGTYLAFTEPESAGMRHLRELAQAGLTHIHLLPVFDIASVDEDRATHQTVDAALLARYPPDSAAQQTAVAAIRDLDGFNWGYDPYHYTVPEGCYAVEPDGAARILEFRAMVKALAECGLRVVMDVVYNHTDASGPHDKSVLDKIVPGYYHRLDAQGQVETSTCCQNTATEHAMMEKLMVDSLVTWATAHKVDGFRFDLMGHHMVDNMIKARDTLRALSPERDGVDGSRIYIYGEGWNFGEVAYGARGINATQRNMAGTGIGTFNDRLRDAVRGGGAFGGRQEQGFATGLWYAPNEHWQGWPDEQRARLLAQSDHIRVGLAGNLRDFAFQDRFGNLVTGQAVPYHDQPTGYTLDPQEVVTYVEAHDNETFFDAVQLKAPAGATIVQRVRMHLLGMSIVALGQGIPFFHAGQDLLRSKSLDRNSFNSGDWFNRLDWTYASNNWGVGLPPGENEPNWPLMRPLLANPALQPGKAEILSAVHHFRELLRIRKSSALFRLRSADAVRASLDFPNTGPHQIPGLIVMRLVDSEDQGTDQPFRRIMILFNARLEACTYAEPSLRDVELELHPVQSESYDPVVREATFNPATGVFVIPAQTTAVFVESGRKSS